MGDDSVVFCRQPIDRLLGQAFHAPNTRRCGQADQVQCGIDAGGGWHVQQALNEVASGQRSGDRLQAADIIDATVEPPCRSTDRDIRRTPQIEATDIAEMLRDELVLIEGRDAIGAGRASVTQSAPVDQT
ncbi:hypothetical protein [Ensifer sp. M14]|uniref:hypothetical protein n=1 Tax=Ensifer sp. M14 TaxID=2203782 RepID=UPI0031B83EA4